MADFHDNFEQLIELLKKIKSKSINQKIGGIDVSFINDFDIIINNYDLIKTTITPDMLNEIGEPMKGLLEGLVDSLKKELNIVVTQSKENGDWENFDSDLERLNIMLTNPNLTNSEIDSLLDKRIELSKKIKSKE
jgi:DNA polymerase III gamma/tau subunit